MQKKEEEIGADVINLSFQYVIGFVGWDAQSTSWYQKFTWCTYAQRNIVCGGERACVCKMSRNEKWANSNVFDFVCLWQKAPLKLNLQRAEDKKECEGVFSALC